MKNQDGFEFSFSEMLDALDILQQDVKHRIDELESLNNTNEFNLGSDNTKRIGSSKANNDSNRNSKKDKSTTKNANNLNNNNNSKTMSLLLSSWGLPNNNSVILNNMDYNFTKSYMGSYNDPILSTLIDKLKENIVSISEDETIANNINQQFNQFSKGLFIYEQKKFSELNSALEQALKENKKLLKQIEKLKERWDGLVASAKRRRTQHLGE